MSSLRSLSYPANHLGKTEYLDHITMGMGNASFSYAFSLIQKIETLIVALKARKRVGRGSCKDSQKALHSELMFQREDDLEFGLG